MRKPTSLSRWFKRIALTVVALYLIAGVTLWFFQRSLIYYANPLLFTPDAPAIAIPSHGLILHGWAINPGHDHALIYFGGKGESVERDVGFFRTTLPDCTVYLVPYRGFGPNAGHPTEKDLFADALVVHDWVRARHPHVAAMGRSLGSGVATWLAAQRPLERLVLVTPYDSILGIASERYPAFPVAWFLEDRYESTRYAPSVHARVLVVLASDDHAIPRAHSEALMTHFPARPDVVVVPHSGHNNIHNSPDYARAVAAFIDPWTTPPAAAPSPAVRPH